MKKTPFWKKLNFKDLFSRKPNRFIELLNQQAQLTEEGMTALVAYFEKPTKRRAEAVDKIETAADEVQAEYAESHFDDIPRAKSKELPAAERVQSVFVEDVAGFSESELRTDVEVDA